MIKRELDTSSLDNDLARRKECAYTDISVSAPTVKPHKRDKRIILCLTDEEHTKIQAKAYSHGLSVNAFIRNCIMERID